LAEHNNRRPGLLAQTIVEVGRRLDQTEGSIAADPDRKRQFRLVDVSRTWRGGRQFDVVAFEDGWGDG
jgi:hypothetical protein